MHKTANNVMDMFEFNLNDAPELDPIESNGTFVVTSGFIIYSNE